MIALFIIIILIITLTGAAGYGIMSLLDSSGIAMNVQRNVVRLDTISTAIRMNSRMENGRIIVPVLSDLSTKLNTSIAPFHKTTWGKDIIYCPVSLGDPIGERQFLGNDDYEVSISKIGSQTYVTGGNVQNISTAQALRDRHVIAMLISPDISSNSEELPKCSDVVFSNDNFSVSGGDVTIVSDIQSNGVGYGRVFVITNGGAVPPGTIAINSFESAASYIVNYGLPDATIRIPGGEQVITYSAFQALQDAVAGRTIRLQGDTGSVLKIDYSDTMVSSEANMRIDGNFSLTNVAVRGHVNNIDSIDVVADVGPAGFLSLIDSSIGGLRTQGGKVFLGAGASISPIHSPSVQLEPVVSFGGQIIASGNSTAVVSSPIAPIGMKTYGGDIVIAGPIFMSINAGAKAFEAFSGGRIAAASATATVSVNAAPAVTVNAAMTLSNKVAVSSLGIKRNLITNGIVACADGSSECEAVCPEGSIISWGECSSANGQSLASFGANDLGTSWVCRWNSLGSVVGPKAKAVCSMLP